jgi:excinuclease ABC subunit B
MGVFDVVVGINLLREGLDLPEVSLVAILDADKEGFLRSDKALIQTTGRAARHVEGKVIMYADKITDSMQRAIDETSRRREVQRAHNEAHGIEPRSIIKALHDLTDDIIREQVHEQERELALADERAVYTTAAEMPKAELNRLIVELEKQMKAAAAALEFEKAAMLRDQIKEMRQTLALKEADAEDLPAWEKMRRLDEAGHRI